MHYHQHHSKIQVSPSRHLRLLSGKGSHRKAYVTLFREATRDCISPTSGFFYMIFECFPQSPIIPFNLRYLFSILDFYFPAIVHSPKI